MSLYLKWTAPNRVPPVVLKGTIPLRRWTRRVDQLEPCASGWHACRWEDAIHHIATELWVCELDGEIVEGPDKVVANRLKLLNRVNTINDRTLRLFAADCAERVLPIFEAAYPNDDRPRQAIEVARRYANGDATSAHLAAAAWAAWAAADSADAAADSADAAARQKQVDWLRANAVPDFSTTNV